MSYFDRCGNVRAGSDLDAVRAAIGSAVKLFIKEKIFSPLELRAIEQYLSAEVHGTISEALLATSRRILKEERRGGRFGKFPRSAPIAVR